MGWGEGSGSRTEEGWRLTLLGVYTCGAEHQRLEDVRQGDDALDVGVLVNHHQSMHLNTHTHTEKNN